MKKHYLENIRLSNRNPTVKKDHKILHRKHTIEQHEPYYKQGITTYYTENIRMSNATSTKNKGSQNTTQKA